MTDSETQVHPADADLESVRDEINGQLRIGHRDWCEGDGDVPRGQRGGVEPYLRQGCVSLDCIEGIQYIPRTVRGSRDGVDWEAHLVRGHYSWKERGLILLYEVSER